ncbi:hypothetical protein L6R53_19630 [Myxococcota bacterium]|nr:hypothetical protein [Myxococcota bacterium]
MSEPLEEPVGALALPHLHLDLSTLYAEVMPWLCRYVQARFPGLCPSAVEDAAQEAFLCALEHPERFARALAEGGPARVDGLCRTIAWRAARGRLARHATRREVGGDALALARTARPAGQELVAECRLRLDRLLEDALARHAPACAATVRLAVVDRVFSGDPETVVARRHGVRREYVNRVRRDLERGLWEAA